MVQLLQGERCENGVFVVLRALHSTFLGLKLKEAHVARLTRGVKVPVGLSWVKAGATAVAEMGVASLARHVGAAM